MKTAAIIIDHWKLPLVKRILSDAGLAFIERPGLTPDMMAIAVETNLLAELQRAIGAAQKECDDTRNNLKDASMDELSAECRERGWWLVTAETLALLANGMATGFWPAAEDGKVSHVE